MSHKIEGKPHRSPAAREDTHALAVAQADESEAIVLDLERPLRAGRHDAAHSWKAGLDKAGRMQWRARPATITGSGKERESQQGTGDLNGCCPSTTDGSSEHSTCPAAALIGFR